MPEIDHVRGIEGHDYLPGPPNWPEYDSLTSIDRQMPRPADPANTSKRYVVETISPHVVEVRVFPNDDEEGGSDQEE